MGFLTTIWGFLQRAWIIAVTEPNKLMHCLKVGLALSLVSLFYYMRPLYQGVGGNAMWAVMTVVVVSEYTVGTLLSSSSFSLHMLLLYSCLPTLLITTYIFQRPVLYITN